MAKQPSHNDQQLAKLFRYAKPRDELSEQEQEEMYTELHTHWQQQVVQQRKSYWQPVAWAASLALLFVLGLAVINQDTQSVASPVIKVASLVRATGDGYTVTNIQGEALSDKADRILFMNGYQLHSGDGALLALDLNAGGMLRVDADTHLEFNSDRSITLHSGRVYFDSGRAPGDSPVYELSEDKFVLRTASGAIRHVGTQFSVTQTTQRTNVKVREGAVHVGSDVHDISIEAGQQLTISDSVTLEFGNVQAFDEEWLWTERIIPAKSFHNRRIHEFVTWVARETGRELVYADAKTEILAKEKSLFGEVELPLLEALDLRLQSADLGYTQEAGQLVIQQKTK